MNVRLTHWILVSSCTMLTWSIPLFSLRVPSQISAATAHLSVSSSNHAETTTRRLTRQAQEELKELIEQLQAKEVQERRDAAYAIADRGTAAAPAVEALIAALEDRDRQVVAASLTALARIGPPAEDAIPALLERLGDRDLQQQYRTAYALGRIGKAAVKPLRETLTDRNSRRRAGAALALRWSGPTATECLAELAGLLDDEKDAVREIAGETLGIIGSPAEATVAKRLEQDSPASLLPTLDALTRIGPEEQETLQGLTRLTAHQVPEVRRAALRALRRSQLPAPQQIDLALAALRDPELAVRAEAMESLSRLGGEVTPALPRLVKLLQGEDATARQAAGEALGKLGKLAEPALADMVAALDQDETTRQMVLAAFASMGSPAVDDVLQALQSERLDVTVASETLGQMGSEAAGVLIDSLPSSSPAQQRAVLRALAIIADPRPEVTDAIVGQIDHPDVSVRREAIEALGTRNSVTSETLTRLFEQLRTAEGALRGSLLTTLVQLKAEPSRLQPEVDRALQAEQPALRISALRSLALLDAVNEMDADQLERLARDEQADVRAALAKSLGSGESQPAAIATLTGLLADPQPEVRQQATRSLGAIGAEQPEVVAAIAGLLDSNLDEDRWAAIEALQAIGGPAYTALPQLQPLLEASDATFRKSAAELLGAFREQHETVVPLLIERLQDDEWSVRHAATESLGGFKQNAKPAVPELAHLLLSDDDREAVRTALRAIDTAGPEAIPALLEGVKHNDGGVKFISVYLLGKVGPEAKQALPMLKKMADEERSRFKGFLLRTIERLEKEESQETGN